MVDEYEEEEEEERVGKQRWKKKRFENQRDKLSYKKLSNFGDPISNSSNLIGYKNRKNYVIDIRVHKMKLIVG